MLLSVTLLPAFALAEGSVRTLNCHLTQSCDDAGACKAADQSIAFRLEPITLAADGSGHYTLHYNDQSADMQAPSEAGPFFWQQGNERNTLLVSSDSHFLWHTLTLAATPTAQVRFLTCSVRQ
jgi:hypothetical protein